MRAVTRGAEVVFVDNRPLSMDGRDLEAAFGQVLDLAIARANDRTAGRSAR